MIVKEIKEFSQIRTKARAYFCFLLERNLPNHLPDISVDDLIPALKRIANELNQIESIYILDNKGKKVTYSINPRTNFEKTRSGESRNNRAYYYRVMKEKRCILTDPYPSIDTNKLVVTAAYPIFNDKNELKYIVCIDITLKNLLNIIHPASIDALTGKFVRYIYGAFSVALALIALFLFIKGIESFVDFALTHRKISVKDMFESTILLTLSLAIFDLVKAIFEEEVLGEHRKNAEDDIHKTMVRFLGSIIIALAIEALMLVFKFAMTDPNKLLYAVYLLVGITALLIGLSLYLKTLFRYKR